MVGECCCCVRVRCVVLPPPPPPPPPLFCLFVSYVVHFRRPPPPGLESGMRWDTPAKSPARRQPHPRQGMVTAVMVTVWDGRLAVHANVRMVATSGTR